jgi:hypothetical protein
VTAADNVHNERIKLVANWFNTLATAIVTAGALVPAAQFIFGILTPGIDPFVIYGSGGLCFGIGILLHAFGQWLLGSLR